MTFCFREFARNTYLTFGDLFRIPFAAAIWFCALVSGFAAATVGVGPSFKGPCGLVLYSVRDEMVHNPSGALDAVGKLGFHYVEIGGTRELSPATPEAQREFLAQLETRNLKAVSCHFTFERLRDDIDAVIRAPPPRKFARLPIIMQLDSDAVVSQ